jgi:hypothetical protein
MAQPEDWTEWLSIASAVHNNCRNTTTGLSPNQILLGYEIKLYPLEQGTSNNQTVEDRTKQMMEKQAQAIEALNKSAQAFQPPSQYRQGDKVWLEASNLRFPHQSSKLNPKRYGPFHILKDLISRILTRTPCIMENPRHIPCITPFPLSRNGHPWTELLTPTS